MIEIIDNFLDTKSLDRIKKFTADQNLIWKHGTMLPKNLVSCDIEENYQEAYLLYSNGKYKNEDLNLIIPIIKKLNASVLLKAKINKTTPRKTNMFVGWHTDMPSNHWAWNKNPKTAIFYINTNDGYTIIGKEEQRKINCVENRIVIFNSNIEHSGVTCCSSENKLLININYY